MNKRYDLENELRREAGFKNQYSAPPGIHESIMSAVREQAGKSAMQDGPSKARMILAVAAAMLFLAAATSVMFMFNANCRFDAREIAKPVTLDFSFASLTFAEHEDSWLAGDLLVQPMLQELRNIEEEIAVFAAPFYEIF